MPKHININDVYDLNMKEEELFKTDEGIFINPKIYKMRIFMNMFLFIFDRVLFHPEEAEEVDDIISSISEISSINWSIERPVTEDTFSNGKSLTNSLYSSNLVVWASTNSWSTLPFSIK